MTNDQRSFIRKMYRGFRTTFGYEVSHAREVLCRVFPEIQRFEPQSTLFMVIDLHQPRED